MYDACRHGVGDASGTAPGLQDANDIGTTTNASTSIAVIQSPRKTPVARRGIPGSVRSGSIGLKALAAGGGAFDLDAPSGPRELRDLDRGARRTMRLEALRVDLVHRGELGHVRQEHRG